MSFLDRPISPPPRKRGREHNEESATETPKKQKNSESQVRTKETTKDDSDIRVIPSPIHLYSIKDLPASENVETIHLKDILTPQSSLDEIWTFNFMHNMEFLRDLIGPDDESRVKIRIVHGYWKQEDEGRKNMEAGVWGDNIKLISAYLPDPFGTHHSKVIVLFRNDDTAQVLVQTANMIPFDHENMTNAVYMTEYLPLKTKDSPTTDFESAICEYFAFYSPSRTGELVTKLKQYDFTSVKAQFIASVPGKFEGEKANKWGIGRLKRLLKNVESHPHTQLFGQFSSVGSFGKTDTWLGPTFHNALAVSSSSHIQPQLRLVYPTLKQVQESLNGYRSGTSIHWTITSPAHEHQEQYMRPLLRKWHSVKAGRECASPHIKTYGRITQDNTFDWILLTSANLSKAAWGAIEGKSPNTGLRIRSYEAGVMFYPALWGEGTVMVPTYKTNFPSKEQIKWAKEKGYRTIVAIRMAWDLPFVKYDDDDVPWVKNRHYEGTDMFGMSW